MSQKTCHVNLRPDIGKFRPLLHRWTEQYIWPLLYFSSHLSCVATLPCEIQRINNSKIVTYGDVCAAHLLRRWPRFAASHARRRAWYATSVHQHHEISSGSMHHWFSPQDRQIGLSGPFPQRRHAHGHHRRLAESLTCLQQTLRRNLFLSWRSRRIHTIWEILGIIAVNSRQWTK